MEDINCIRVIEQMDIKIDVGDSLKLANSYIQELIVCNQLLVGHKLLMDEPPVAFHFDIAYHNLDSVGISFIAFQLLLI